MQNAGKLFDQGCMNLEPYGRPGHEKIQWFNSLPLTVPKGWVLTAKDKEKSLAIALEFFENNDRFFNLSHVGLITKFIFHTRNNEKFLGKLFKVLKTACDNEVHTRVDAIRQALEAKEKEQNEKEERLKLELAFFESRKKEIFNEIKETEEKNSSDTNKFNMKVVNFSKSKGEVRGACLVSTDCEYRIHGLLNRNWSLSIKRRESEKKYIFILKCLEHRSSNEIRQDAFYLLTNLDIQTVSSQSQSAAEVQRVGYEEYQSYATFEILIEDLTPYIFNGHIDLCLGVELRNLTSTPTRQFFKGVS